jgi:hypothetical protein
MSTLRRYTAGIGALAVCIAALSMSLVGSAGAAPAGAHSQHKTRAQLHSLPTPLPFPITQIVPSDRVSFDITAAGLGPGRQAEVAGGLTPSFVFNSPGGWNQVTHVGTGHYCLNTPPGILAFNYPAVVSVANRFGSANVPGGLVRYDSFGSGCPGVGVFTYEIVP